MRALRLSFTIVAFQIATGAAWAQTATDQNFSVQLFEPAIGIKDTFFSVESAGVANHLAFGFAGFLHYQHRPLVIYSRTLPGTGASDFDLDNASRSIDLVSNQLNANVMGAVGLHYKWFHAQVGLDLPVTLMTKGHVVNSQGDLIGKINYAGGLGDLRLQLKVQLLREWHGLSIAFSPILTFPTSTYDSFGGDPSLSFRPRVALDYRIGDLLIAANLGYLVRESTTFFSSEIGDRFLYGVAIGYQVHKRIFAMVEVFGQAGFNTKSNCKQDPLTGTPICSDTSAVDLDAFPLELMFGGHVNIARGFSATIGAGFGLIKAVGSPEFRLLAGLRWAPDFKDTDSDGVYDREDKCPTQPEDKDGFQDADGCPEPDNDRDRIPDTRDKCPNRAEDRDGYQDHDGCPELDNDKDGIPDLHDECPMKKETLNKYKDKDGCPDTPERDGDGIPDHLDKCPDEREDVDNFQDEDGCPDPDNDNDSVPDNLDDCPLEAEDIDNFKDDDGCPEPDNDSDGVLDAKDKCPNKPETINGYKDHDGCPDRGKSHVIIKENKIVITKKVYFATGRAKIKRRSYGILNEVALVLRANPQIKGIRVEGHTDNRGKVAYNTSLSQKRADAVREYLIKRGTLASRLFAVGYGPEKPVDSNRTSKGRANNRRVEFTILEQAPGKAP
jgi:outer membrane protein OmpA-like peptidoglycan-associated protein